MTVTDPTYRLLRLIIFTSNQETAVDAIVKVLTSVNTVGQAALLQSRIFTQSFLTIVKVSIKEPVENVLSQQILYTLYLGL